MNTHAHIDVLADTDSPDDTPIAIKVVAPGDALMYLTVWIPLPDAVRLYAELADKIAEVASGQKS